MLNNDRGQSQHVNKLYYKSKIRSLPARLVIWLCMSCVNMKMSNTIYSHTSWFWELSKGNKELFIQDNCPFEGYSFEIIKPTTPIPTKPVTVRIEAVIMSTPNMGLFDWPDNVALILA